MCARLGVDDWRAALADPVWAERNDNAQTLLTGLGLRGMEPVGAHGCRRPAAIAGYSVGELAAFSAAGAIDPAPRGSAGDLSAPRPWTDCAARAPGGLLAVSGLVRAGSSNSCAPKPASNSPSATATPASILGGPIGALDDAERIAAALGAQFTRLRVNVASHTPWMREAVTSFLAHACGAVPFHGPRVALVQQRGRSHPRCTALPELRWRPRSRERFAGTNAWKTSRPDRSVACWKSARARRWHACGISATPPFRLALATTSAVPQRSRPG